MLQNIKQRKVRWGPTVVETPRPAEVNVLIREVERYLAAVAVFRGMGCEPTWRS